MTDTTADALQLILMVFSLLSGLWIGYGWGVEDGSGVWDSEAQESADDDLPI